MLRRLGLHSTDLQPDLRGSSYGLAVIYEILNDVLFVAISDISLQLLDFMLVF